MKKEPKKRICVTLPLGMYMNFREIAQMMNCSISAAVRRRLEVRGPCVVVPASISEELRLLHQLLEASIKQGTLPSEVVDVWRQRLEMFDRLLHFESETSFWHGRKKTCTSRKQAVASQQGSGVVEC